MLTIVTFLGGSAGLVLVSQDEIALVVMGAMLVVGSAILFARHFWRESDRKRKQEMSAYQRSLGAEMAKVTEITEQSRADVQDAVDSVSHKVDVFTQGVLEYMAQLELDFEQVEERAKTLETGQAVLMKRHDQTDRSANKRRDSVVQQITAVQNLYHRFRPSAPYPPFGGWAIGGECAYLLVSLVLRRRPRFIVEIGSGLSSILIGQALAMNDDGGHSVSLEHDAEWLERSQAMIKEHGVEDWVRVAHAPLVDVTIGQEVFKWYDLSVVDIPPVVDLIFIDGPPEATGPLARYPAVPLLYERLRSGGVILMDDAARAGESAAMERWTDEFPDLEFQFHNDSKGSVEITKR
jgi:predicted O-methyltransferase YrrM